MVKYQDTSPGLNMLVIHDNEDTGVRAGLEYISMYGGSLIDSQYGDARNFRFDHQDGQHETDPNSIYTRPGIFTGLNKFNGWNQEAGDMLFSTGEAIMKYYQPESKNYIVTLHNNTDNAFSIWSYLEGGELETTADSVFINFDMDEDDFLIVTIPAHFNHLKAKNVNVVLQSQDAPNDGSLSIYAMYRGIPYVNVEVQHGHKDEHYRLIKVVGDMLRKDERLASIR
ncbi:MAG: hypothetical protein EOO00_03685 [Chitinophagaceae bacterium]|nr:MAG: hypothetical protein EOO00_03685 [Chitinophagaceae bacterium]